MSLMFPYGSSAGEEEDRKRKAEIEDMMRWQRESYFRNEPVQQEYRDLVTRLSGGEESRSGLAADFQEPGPFDLAVRTFQKREDANGTLSHFHESVEPDETKADVRPDGLQKRSAADKHLIASVEMLPSEKVAPVRVAQNAPSSGPVQGGAQARPFATDGVNRVDQFQSKVATMRKGPLSWALEDQLNYAAFKTGLQAEVRSGGQPVYGQRGVDWKGYRHNDGGAGDVKLFEITNGKKRYLNYNNDADRQKMADFIRHSVIAGATGIGLGYMGPETIHIGGGKELTWRAEPNATAFPWVQKVFDEGRAERQKLMKGGWNGLVDTLARGRPLSLKPPQQSPPTVPTPKERAQKFPPMPRRLLPDLY